MILWQTVFSSGDLGWIAIVPILSMLLFIIGFVLIFSPRIFTEVDPAIWQSLPLHVAVLTVAWGLWVFSIAFAPSVGTVPALDPNPRPMLSLQEMMVIEDAKVDETHLYGRGGVFGNMDYVAMGGMMPVVGPERPMFAAKRPLYHLPLILEFFFRWCSFMIVVLPLALLWSRSLTSIRLGMMTVLWSTLVYAPVVHAVSGDGWLQHRGAIDFSLGLVLLSSGFSALFGVPKHVETGVCSGSARQSATGGLLMWFGMSLHVSAYTFQADGRAMIALVNMLVGTGCGLLIWSFCNSFLWNRPFSEHSAAGILAGLATIAPGAGYMFPQSAMILCCSSAALSNILYYATSRRNPHDPQRFLFFTLGISSMTGLMGAGMFATTGVGGLRWDGREILGAIQGNTNQLTSQGLAIAATVVWSTLVTWLLFTLFLRQRTNV
jgi:ammonia channel protein AmtB